MTRDMYMTMMDGLVATIKEKALVGGQDDRVRELVDIVDDLQEFWNGDEEFTRFDYNISEKRRLGHEIGVNSHKGSGGGKGKSGIESKEVGIYKAKRRSKPKRVYTKLNHQRPAIASWFSFGRKAVISE